MSHYFIITEDGKTFSWKSFSDNIDTSNMISEMRRRGITAVYSVDIPPYVDNITPFNIIRNAVDEANKKGSFDRESLKKRLRCYEED